MAEPNEEAAVNALHVQHEYGDEDLKKDIERLIINVVQKHVVNLSQQMVVLSAREIEKIVARYLTNKLSNDQY